MTEKDALKKFYESARCDDLQGCLESLQYISIDTINRQDDDDYDMLISAAVSGNGCAITALLQDNRCDRTHVENLCGMTAEEYISSCPELRQAFEQAPAQEFIYRNGKVIARGDIFDRIMDDTLECDKGCFDMLPGDFYRVGLLTGGKISKEDFTVWLNPAELYWDAQIALLVGDEEYGRTLVDWDYIREAAEPNDWLSFLRYLPQYADHADWDKLIREGSQASWQALSDVRPEFKDKYEAQKVYREKTLKKYTKHLYCPPLNLAKACQHNDIEVVKFHILNSTIDLNKNYIYPMPPGFPAELPLATAVKAGAMECIEFLLENGADPDVRCNHKSNYKTPRELAAGNPEILKLFSIYQGEKSCED